MENGPFTDDFPSERNLHLSWIFSVRYVPIKPPFFMDFSSSLCNSHYHLGTSHEFFTKTCTSQEFRVHKIFRDYAKCTLSETSSQTQTRGTTMVPCRYWWKSDSGGGRVGRPQIDWFQIASGYLLHSHGIDGPNRNRWFIYMFIIYLLIAWWFSMANC